MNKRKDMKMNLLHYSSLLQSKRTLMQHDEVRISV